MCIRDRYQRRVRGLQHCAMPQHKQEQVFESKAAFVPTKEQHATAVSERWSVVGGGWGVNPHTPNDAHQNYQGVGQSTWGRAVERAYRREDAEQWRRSMDQQYRDALNNARDSDTSELCEQNAEREVKAIYDSAAEVTRRANYKAQYVRDLAWREEQQQLHNARESDLEQNMQGAHEAEEQKRQWLEEMQDAASLRASLACQLAAQDAVRRADVETTVNANFAKVIEAEGQREAAQKAAREQAQLEKFKADIQGRRAVEIEERDRHRTYVSGFSYSANRAPLPAPDRHNPCTKPRALVYPIRGWRHKSHVN
eukprot:TRINITY_DN5208_c0_g1_i1.p1 TRINITY_DN5208_c0_g1~~TRINITY_DN5208_c0_g1_i1.p1  ORF type:complete len:311 (+),score=79.79 TRINITY_DN5208_c0_g1_i1:138-1070(+)